MLNLTMYVTINVHVTPIIPNDVNPILLINDYK